MAVLAADGRSIHTTHDATEYGIHSTFNEVVGSAGVQLEIDGSDVPFRPDARETREYLGIDP